ncbi:MAG: hybrid sensor histidine kinase/response regulator, partial [Candidatus Anammoxibacter sp.]
MSGDKNTILIVDDERDIVDTLYDFFIDKYNVLKAYDGKEALQVVKDNPKIDLIISDQRMADVSGVEMFEEIQKTNPGIGKVLLTGYSDIQAVVDGINKGNIDKFISKPWDEEALTGIVVDVLNAKLKNALAECDRMEDQLMQSSRLASLGELTAGVIHEINNPLAFITGNIGNISRALGKILGLIEFYDANVDGAVKEAADKKKEEINFTYSQTRIIEILERYKVSAGRMKKIITDMKAFARSDTEGFAEGSIEEAIEVTLTLIVHEYKNRIEIKKEFGHLPPMVCNISKLNQVFMNLLVNACHAIKEKGEIVIKIRSEGDMAVVEIRDNGDGISDEVKERMFEAFYTTKEKGKGTGLGLSITKKIIKQHNGEIIVNSKVGEGTTFIIKIPMNLKKNE